MMRILKQRVLCGGSSNAIRGAAGNPTAAGSQAVGIRTSSTGQRDDSNSSSRQNSTLQPTTDILSHLQELKDMERQVLGRNGRDAQQPATPGASGPASSEEIKSRQERLAREKRMANQYREQLKLKLQDIDDSAIDLAAQKATMAHFERQLLGSSSPRELEQLELERVNGIRSLIGLPALPVTPIHYVSGTGSVRPSRPSTPLYFPSSPSHISSSHHHHSRMPGAGPQYRTGTHHQRTSSFGDNTRSHSSLANHGSGLTRYREGAASEVAFNDHSGAINDDDGDGGDDDEVRDMDLDLEEGEVSEEGELAE
ncbi:hypothetical protein H4217_004978 [Coemansia sp. RSA 1939]|nr:hypothetical protein H4217_004978 [Coemansia sp. RSA 1939]KAJ2600537.1 hypothetical protein EV177_007126 [Coemansia sp. RSA 1804]